MNDNVLCEEHKRQLENIQKILVGNDGRNGLVGDMVLVKKYIEQQEEGRLRRQRKVDGVFIAIVVNILLTIFAAIYDHF